MLMLTENDIGKSAQQFQLQLQQLLRQQHQLQLQQIALHQRLQPLQQRLQLQLNLQLLQKPLHQQLLQRRPQHQLQQIALHQHQHQLSSNQLDTTTQQIILHGQQIATEEQVSNHGHSKQVVTEVCS